MTGQLIITEQRYPSGGGPLTYGVFLETEEVIEGLAHWQDCDEIFVCYSRSIEGATRAIKELQTPTVSEKGSIQPSTGVLF